MDYMLKEPDQNSDQKYGRKFPLQACRVFSLNIDHITQYFIKHALGPNDHIEHNYFVKLQRLLDFVAVKEPLNPVLSGYFATVLKTKMKNDPYSTYAYIFRDSQFTDNLFAHIEDASVTSVLKMILNDNLEAIKEGIEMVETKSFWQNISVLRSKLLLQLVDELLKTKLNDDQYEKHCNFAEILGEICDNQSTDLLDEYALTYLASSLLRCCLNINSEYSCKAPSLLGKLNLFCQKKKIHINFDSISTEAGEAISSIGQSLREHIELPDAQKTMTEKSEEILPFIPKGRRLLQLAEVVEFLVVQNIPILNELLIAHSYLPEMTVAFSFRQYLLEKHPWINLLHDRILSIISILSQRPNECPLANHFFTNPVFVEALTSGVTSHNKSNLSDATHKGYLSHYLLICDLVTGSHNETLSKHLIKNVKWNQFLEIYYYKTIEKLGMSKSGIKAKKNADYFDYFFSADDITEKFKTFLHPEPAEIAFSQKEKELTFTEYVKVTDVQNNGGSGFSYISMQRNNDMKESNIGCLLEILSPVHDSTIMDKEISKFRDSPIPPKESSKPVDYPGFSIRVLEITDEKDKQPAKD